MWRRWDTPQNFLFAFIAELWKTWKIRILKKWGTVSEIWSETEFFVILDHFLPLHPFSHPSLTIQKIKTLKKWEKYLEMSSFHTCTPKNTIIWCTLTQIWHVADIIFCHFRSFFAFTPLFTKKIKICKICKKTPRYIILFT